MHLNPSVRRGFAGAVIGLAVAACTSSSVQTWTFGPTLRPSAGASASSATPGSLGAPSSGPSGAAGASAAPSAAEPGSAGTVLDLTAKNIAYDKAVLSAPASVPFTIHFDNEDSGIPHDVAIMRGSASGPQVFRGQIITGVAATDYKVPSLPAGTYTIICVVHPTQMIATLTVK